ncbi:MAG: GFA family protein [Sphingomonadaceae bacterium]
MSLTGRCHCGAISYSLEGEPQHSSLCHCEDCRRCAGAPVVGWAAFEAEQVTINGSPASYASSEHATRQFCGTCGAGLFYVNEQVLPGLIDIQIATLDDPEALPPQIQVQAAERLGWMNGVDDLPAFERYPAG